MRPSEMSRRIRFGPYEADFHTQELRKHGTKLKLSGQPLQVLEVLLARPGQLVSRAELQQLLWPGQVFIDSSHGLNAAVNKLREALSDSASEPKYIETLPRRGYRFIGTIETSVEQPLMRIAELPGAGDAAQQSIKKYETKTPMPSINLAQRGARNWLALSAAAAVFLCVIGLIGRGARPVNRAENVEPGQKAAAEKSAANMPGTTEPEVRQMPLASVVKAIARGTAEWQEKLAKKNVLNSAAGVRARNLETAMDDDAALASNEGLQPALRVRRVIWGDGGNAAPQFSPDGKRIAFMSNRDGTWEIWMSDADGSRPRQVSFTESAGTPRWSPDGKSIAFDAPFDNGTWIFVVRIDETERAQPMVEGLVPSFSRDGKWIYFASQQTGDWQVWKTSVNGGGAVQVTFHGGFAALESTDGYVYYSKSRYSQPEICRVRIKGSEESCGFEHLRPRTWASWAPTREGIVFAEDLPNGKAALSLYDPARRQVRDLLQLQSAPFWVGASVDGRKAIMNDAAEQQISMVDHLH